MASIGTSENFWNERVQEDNGNYGLGLNLSEAEIAFQRNHFVPGGDTLVLGGTPKLCAAALDISGTVTAVDYAGEVIANAKRTLQHPRRDEIRFVHSGWLSFLKENTEKYDNITTDGGLLCLEFPDSWDEHIEQIKKHLKPRGIFAAKVYVYIRDALPDVNQNPNLSRFMTIPTSEERNWIVEPTGEIYKRNNMRYWLPPRDVVLQKLGSFTRIDEMKADYPEGRRFLSFAWQQNM